MSRDQSNFLRTFVNEAIANYDGDPHDHITTNENSQKQFHLRSGSINFDKGCLSCRGEPAHTVKMFKMACLSYKPNPVSYRENHLSRKKLLSMRKTLIDKCEEVIGGHQWAGNDTNMRPSKLFNDLIEFHSGRVQNQVQAH